MLQLLTCGGKFTQEPFKYRITWRITILFPIHPIKREGERIKELKKKRQTEFVEMKKENEEVATI